MQPQSTFGGSADSFFWNSSGTSEYVLFCFLLKNLGPLYWRGLCIFTVSLKWANKQNHNYETNNILLSLPQTALIFFIKKKP